MARRNTLNRITGKVFGWFDSKDARVVDSSVARFNTRARLALTDLEDRSVPAAFVVLNDGDGGPTGSLATQIGLLNASTDPTNTLDLVTNFASPTKITLTAALPSLAVPVTITGSQTAGVNNVTIDGGGAVFLFDASAAPLGTAIVFDKLNMSNGFDAGIGGALFLTTQVVTVSNSTITGCTAGEGGAAYVQGTGTLNITNSTITNCSAALNTGLAGGGALEVISGTLNITNSTISNSTANAGGGIFAINAIVNLTNSTLSGNKATGGAVNRGGGFYAQGTTFSITGSTVSGNSATTLGGAFSGGSATQNITFTNSTVSNNSASQGAGFFLFANNSFTASGSTFSGNISAASGAVMDIQGAVTTFLMTNCTVSGNSTPTNGGFARILTAQPNFTIRNSTITNNTSGSASTTKGTGGGGLTINATGTYNLISTIVANNKNPNGTFADLSVLDTATFNVDNSAIGTTTGFIIDSGTANLTGVAATIGLDPTLSSNGGATKTHALLPTSVAIDAGSNPGGLTTDQRGQNRAVNGKVGGGIVADIGSYEFIPASTVSGTFPAIETYGRGPNGYFDFTQPNIGKTNYTVTVLYSAPLANTVNVGTIDITDLQVTGPGYTGNPTAVSMTTTDGGKNYTATYTLPAPGGSFDFTDNNSYTVSLVGTVTTTAGTIPTGAIGAPFLVDIGKQYVVTSALDSGANTLRQALTDAATDTPTALDIVTFGAPDFSGASDVTITLASNIASKSAIFINNTTGKGITLAAPTARAITFSDTLATVIEAKISGINVTGGTASGALTIGTNDVLTFESGTISGSTTGGNGGAVFVNAGGSLNVSNSTLSGNTANSGGAIYFDNGGSLAITNSTLSGNVATGGVGGGALYFYGSSANLRVINSTISGNSAATGGGIVLLNTTTTTNLEIINSTIAFNTATTGGGIARENAQGKITLTSSIVANNFAATAPDISIAGNGNVDVINATFSAIGTDPGASLSAASKLGAAKNLPFGSKLYLTPLFNFGGTTKVHGIATGSALINAGTTVALTPTTDQRGAGFPRVDGPSADIGSFEGVLARPGANTSLVNISPGSSFDTKATATIVVKYTAQAGQTIASSQFGKSDITVTGPTGALTVSGFSVVDTSAGAQTSYDVTYTVSAPGGSWDAADRGRYTVAVVANEVQSSNTVPVLDGTIGTFGALYANTFVVDTNLDVVNALDGVTSLREAIAAANDPNLNPAADVITFFKGTPTGNQVDFTTSQVINIDAGLGQFVVNDSLTITGTGKANLSFVGGGDRHFFINPTANNFTLTGVTLTGGTSTGRGGSMVINSQTANFDDVEFNNNGATGGAVITSGFSTAITMTNSKVSSNTSNGSLENGAVISFTGALDYPSFKAVNTEFSNNNNIGTGRGSVVSMTAAGVITIQNCIVASNSANGAIGGAFYFVGGTAQQPGVLLIENSTLTGNSGGFGAVISTFGTLNATIRNSTFANNISAAAGGVLHLNDSAAPATTVLIEGSTFKDNVANGFGSGVANLNSGTITVRNSTFSGNQATNGLAANTTGGASVINVNTGTILTVQNSTFTNNVSNASPTTPSDVMGGAISNSGTLTIVSSVLFNNTAANGNNDIASSTTGNPINLNFSSVGDGDDFVLSGSSGNNRAFGEDPLFDLAGLANNGGPTETIALQATSPLINTGSNPANLFRDQRGFFRSIGQTDIGAYEFGSSATLPDVTGIVVNGGATQRSRLTTVVVNFASPVDPSLLTAAGKVFFTRTGIPTNGQGTIGTVVNNTNGLIITPSSGPLVSSVTLTFSNVNNAGVNAGSLADGRWQLSIPDAGFTSANTLADIQLRRLFGDVDNNGTVDGTDFGAFPPFGTIVGNPFDFDNNGSIDGNDFSAFGGRFGYSLA